MNESNNEPTLFQELKKQEQFKHENYWNKIYCPQILTQI